MEKSLNEILIKGPNLLPLIIILLIRNRLTEYLLQGDISKAFFGIGLDPSQWSLTRMLWKEVIPKKPEEFEILKNFEWKHFEASGKLKFMEHMVLPMGLTVSPCVLMSVINMHLKKLRTQKVMKLNHNYENYFYADNIILAGNDIEDLKEQKIQSTGALQLAGFNLTKWESNESSINEVPDSESKFLGVKWKKENDEILINNQKVIDYYDKQNGWSRRRLLALIGSCYDGGLGYTTPFVLPLKIIHQEICRISADMDLSLDDEHIQKLNEWRNNIIISEIILKRKLLCLKDLKLNNNQSIDLRLIIYCDASASAYGIVAYLEYQRNMSIILLKAKIQPKKPMVIARAELQACVLAAEYADHIQKSIDLLEGYNLLDIIALTDSQVALAWITVCNTWKPVITRRVTTIISKIPAKKWYYVPKYC